MQTRSISPYKQQRFDAVYAFVRDNGEVGLTELSQHLGLTSRVYVRSLADELVAAGWLCCEFKFGRWSRFVYSINPEQVP
jgi:hypothetical protein